MVEIRRILFAARAVALCIVASGCGNRDHAAAPTSPTSTTVPTIALAAQSAGVNAASLVWSSTDSSSASFRVYRDNAVIATVGALSYSDAALSPSHQYAYRVSTVGSDGRDRLMSNTVMVRTDSIRPDVFVITVSPSNFVIAVGDSVRPTAAVYNQTAGLWVPSADVSWSTSAPSVATVRANGWIRGESLGSTSVIASYHGYTGSGIVSIIARPSTPDTTAATITVTPSSLALHVGDGADLKAVVQTASGIVLDRPLTWSSSSPSVASVSATGRVTAIANGSATISVSIGSVSASVLVTVTTASSPPPNNPPAVPVYSVSVSPNQSSLNVGSTVALTATTRDQSGNALSGRPVTWMSSNTAVATVSPSGTVTAVGAGSATIAATSEGITGTAAVTVTAPQTPPSNPTVTSVSVAPSSANIYVDSTVQLSATAKDGNGSVVTGQSVSWSSSNAGVATVSPSGAVKGVSAGTATITATVNGVAGTATVNVSNAPVTPPSTPTVASVSVSPPTGSAAVYSTFQFTATALDSHGAAIPGAAITWSSSDANVASVSSSGLVTGIATGSATITATSNGVSGTATMTVTPPPVASVSISPPSGSAAVGETLQLTATPRDSHSNVVAGAVVTWTSSDQNVATVSSNGLVTGVGTGTVTITGTSGGVSGTATVTITPQIVATVTIAPPGSLCVGASLQLSASARDSHGALINGRAVVWTSSSLSIATVGSTGLVTGLTLGSVTITATIDGVSSSVTLSLCPAVVASIAISPSGSTLSLLAGLLQFTATPHDGNGNPIVGRSVTWAVTPANRALISLGGLLTPLSLGSITVSATIDGVTASTTITILP